MKLHLHEPFQILDMLEELRGLALGLGAMSVTCKTHAQEEALRIADEGVEICRQRNDRQAAP